MNTALLATLLEEGGCGAADADLRRALSRPYAEELSGNIPPEQGDWPLSSRVYASMAHICPTQVSQAALDHAALSLARLWNAELLNAETGNQAGLPARRPTLPPFTAEHSLAAALLWRVHRDLAQLPGGWDAWKRAAEAGQAPEQRVLGKNSARVGQGADSRLLLPLLEPGRHADAAGLLALVGAVQRGHANWNPGQGMSVHRVWTTPAVAARIAGDPELLRTLLSHMPVLTADDDKSASYGSAWAQSSTGTDQEQPLTMDPELALMPGFTAAHLPARHLPVLRQLRDFACRLIERERTREAGERLLRLAYEACGLPGGVYPSEVQPTEGCSTLRAFQAGAPGTPDHVLLALAREGQTEPWATRHPETPVTTALWMISAEEVNTPRHHTDKDEIRCSMLKLSTPDSRP